MKNSNRFPNNQTVLRSIVWSTTFVLLSLLVVAARPITSAQTGLGVSGNPMGQHRVLVVMVNFQDKQTQPFTREQAQAVMFGTTSDFYREASYGQTWLTGDVYGWYRQGWLFRHLCELVGKGVDHQFETIGDAKL